MVMRYVRTQKGDMFIASTAVIQCEAFKMMASLAIILYQEKSVPKSVRHLVKNIIDQPVDCIRMSIPAIIYVFQNNLFYVAVSNLDAATCQIMYRRSGRKRVPTSRANNGGAAAAAKKSKQQQEEATANIADRLPRTSGTPPVQLGSNTVTTNVLHSPIMISNTASETIYPAPELLKYMQTVRLGAKRYAGLGWKLYDEQFRLRRSQEPAGSWSVIDTELWLLYIQPVLSKKKMALKELESITGLMAFCSRAIISARAFIRRFYDLIASVKNGKPYYTVRLNSEVKADARVWLNFLDQFNGQCYFLIDFGRLMKVWNYSLIVQEQRFMDLVPNADSSPAAIPQNSCR
ncbi:SLC35A1_2_3 [Mytilus edulis]|uniref:SLC35A1_2_3 n=1 Tax=Mytilus edulis TaxID=6550 RepID=A0A8S3VDC9_MYTED|nr:SLC35A1_2_3 [Mytilus edulis]